MFRGATNLTLDAKGRMAMPARYRETLCDLCDGEMVVTVDYAKDRYLLVYPKPHWETFQSELMALPSFDPEVRMVQRMMLGHATDTKMDSHSRILITPTLRKFASLEKQVVLTGQSNKFELWDEQAWHERCDSIEWSEDLAKKLASLSL